MRQRLLTPWPRLRSAPWTADAAEAVLRAASVPARSRRSSTGSPTALHDHPLLLSLPPRDLLTYDQVAGRAPLPDPVPVPPEFAAEWVPTLDGLSVPSRAGALLDVALSLGPAWTSSP